MTTYLRQRMIEDILLRLVPPLIISEDELLQGIGILDQVFKKIKEA